MPIFNFIQWTDGVGTLTKDGPIIPVEIGMPATLEEWFVKNGIPVPAPVSGFALIDTGASMSGIHEPILQALSVVPIDSIPLTTPSGEGRAFVYPTRVSFPALNVQGYSMNRVVGSQLDWEASDNKRVIMLLGRDLLDQFLMIYNPQVNQVTLAY